MTDLPEHRVWAIPDEPAQELSLADAMKNWAYECYDNYKYWTFEELIEQFGLVQKGDDPSAEELGVALDQAEAGSGPAEGLMGPGGIPKSIEDTEPEPDPRNVADGE